MMMMIATGTARTRLGQRTLLLCRTISAHVYDLLAHFNTRRRHYLASLAQCLPLTYPLSPEEYVRCWQGCAIIPVLMPGYSPPTPTGVSSSGEQSVLFSWWPKALPPLPDTTLYVDLRDPNMVDWVMRKVLIPRINSILQSYNGALDPNGRFGEPKDFVPCPECVERGDLKPNLFGEATHGSFKLLYYISLSVYIPLWSLSPSICTSLSLPHFNALPLFNSSFLCLTLTHCLFAKARRDPPPHICRPDRGVPRARRVEGNSLPPLRRANGAGGGSQIRPLPRVQ